MSFRTAGLPGSIKQVTLLAFIVLVMPIGWMLYQTNQVLDTQLQQSHEQARLALELNQQNYQLERLAEDIVRSVIQFQITQAEPIKARLSEQIDAFRNQLSVQRFLTEQTLFADTFEPLLNALEVQPDSEVSQALATHVSQLTQQSLDTMSEKLTRLQQQSASTRQTLWLQNALLILTTCALMLWLARVISRPITALEARIQAVGQRQPLPASSHYSPLEIQALNAQIEWLDAHLHALEESKVQFLRHISHELKTPLTTLREGADLLADEVPGALTMQQRHVVGLLQKSGLNLQQLIEQLLDYNKLQQPYEPMAQTVNPQQCLQTALAPLQLLIQEKDLTVNVSSSSHTVQLDGDMLQRIINNLVSNAVYYSDPCGMIEIRCHQTRQQLTVEVSNTGTPIAEADVKHIFEPFYQGQRKRGGPLKGSGIGLSIAREASHALGGSLILKHNEAGQICFSATVPVHEANEL